MEKIEIKLNLITNSWNTYFWGSKYLQSKINFNYEVQLNYYGDILYYFNDTLELLKFENNLPKDFSNNIFYAIGLLQIIYVQQDLIDELLYIFKLVKSSKDDKNPNRQIRNELVGHPINRDNGKLQSTIIFGNDLSEITLNYIKYNVSEGFIGKSCLETYESIITHHINFLDKYFKIIWGQVVTLLKKYKVKLLNFENAIINGIELEKIVKLSELLVNQVFKSNVLFEKEIIIKCNKKRKEHIRYSYAVELFINEIKATIKEFSQNIDKIVNTENDTIIKLKTINKDNHIIDKKNNNHLYEISKLHDRHPIFGLPFFKKKYREDDNVIEELNNMEQNYNSDLEYYCSFELIKKLIKNDTFFN